VGNSGELGLFKIISESGVAAGVRRIEGVTGRGVLDFISSRTAIMANAAQALKIGNIAELDKKAASLMAELKAKDDEIKALTALLTELRSGSMFDNAQDVDGLKVIAASAGEVSVDELRSLCDKAKLTGENVVAVIAAVNSAKGSANFAVACGKEAIAKGVRAGDVVKMTAQIAGGNGGGKPDFAMAGAKNLDKIDEALAAAAQTVASLIK
ncbi:MAG: alanine--tRNA ligase, partial [Clostridia bacterium]|nr:alanine--tRNA ligase [Clostridia bacterium]